MSKTFEARLEERRSAPLYGTLPRYQHIERLGHEAVEGLLDGEVVVQEKLDGANATVGMSDGQFIIATRNQAISVDGNPPTGFHGLVEYVLNNPAFLRIARAGWVLRGEWLVRHSLDYNPESYGHLYIFDVQTLESGMDYLPPHIYEPALHEEGIKTVPVLARLTRPTVDDIVPLSQGPSAFGKEREGVVVKRYGFVNKFGKTVWGKIISSDFKEQNKLHFRPLANDPKELRFAALASEPFIIKTLLSVADQRGESPRVQHMSDVLRRVWHDLFTEELWDFVFSERVTTFDFSLARKFVETKTRSVALAYYNGVRSVHSPTGGGHP